MQSTLTRKIYGSSTSTTNDLAHLDIGYRCRLVAMSLVLSEATPGTTDNCRAQLSVASTGSLAVNDPQGVLAEAAVGFILSTSGVGNPTANFSLTGLSIILPAGTRIYLHTLQVGTAATTISGLLFLEPF